MSVENTRNTYTFRCEEITSSNPGEEHVIEATHFVQERLIRGKIQRDVSWTFKNVTLGITLHRKPLKHSDVDDQGHYVDDSGDRLFVSFDPEQPAWEPDMRRKN
jgi:hypothetical protein